MAHGTVAIPFVRSAVDAAPAGVRTAMREARLPDAARLSCEETVTATRVLWQATDDELLGLGPRPIPLGTFRMIALGLIHTPDLRAALERLIEFAAITTGFPSSRLVVDGAACRIEIAGRDAVMHSPAAEIVLAATHRFAAWLAGRRIPLTMLEMPFPEPAHSAGYPEIFGLMPSFDAPAAAIGFDAAHLAAPVVRGEAELLDYLRRSPADLLYHRDYGSSTADRVRAILERGDAGHWQSAGEVAARLSVSTQHLRRLLSREGTSFHEIREDVLRGLAVADLRGGRHSIDEISYRLGFSEPSAFRRAFTRWFGVPPGEYRDRLARPAQAARPARALRR